MILEKLRNDEINIKIVNILAVIYLFSLTISYKISGTLIYIILFIFLLNPKVGTYLKNSLKNSFVQAGLLYLAVILIWFIGTHDLSFAITQLKINKFYLLPILFFAFIRVEYFKYYVLAFILGAIVNFIWTYLMFFNIIDNDYSNLIIYQSEHAFLIFLTIISLFYRLVKYEDKLVYKILIIFIILLLSSNVFLLKKTQIVSYVIVLFVAFIYLYRKDIVKILIFSLTFLSIFLIGINFLFPTVKYQLLHELDGVQKAIQKQDFTNSMSARLGVAYYSLQVIEDSPIFGYGTGDHAYEVKKAINNSELKNIDSKSYDILIGTLITGKHVTLHNTFLQVLVQYGIIGLLIFLNIFYQILKFTRGETNIYSLLIVSSVTIAFLQFLSGWDFQFGNLAQIFIITICLLILSQSKEKLTR
ncbi:O-antigen ligase family protein [Arcobacter cryaerophilus gv. pseudocryaerophilus]|uniref:O-antigen ligase family protein n=3 Tax=Arcobacteraceae TaxID=2808963 RepID=A0AA96DV53_9BACT|nr:O-antigen ligase family protein [Arcobacter sp. AZ-2023]WNL35736.1 O-antigen ligase family protein [Arcobacter sp. AZ-2023]WPD11452.1 O-antigen ligase family protein [Arcobacter sp. DSM 115960]